jgi:hypothetical protein
MTAPEPIKLADLIGDVERHQRQLVEDTKALETAQRAKSRTETQLANAQNLLGRQLAKAEIIGGDFRLITFEELNALTSIDRVQA